MAEKKISQLPILSEVTGGAILPIVAGDTTYQVSVEELSGYTEELIRAIISGSNTYVGTQTYNGVINATNNLTVAGILSATEITTLNVYTSSFNNLQGFTSSLRNEVNGIEAYTASLKGTTLISGSAQISALGFSAATNGTVSSSAQITELPYIHSTTSSLNVFTGSVQSEVNALKIATSSYVVNSLTSSFVSYGILSQSFANFTSSVVNLHNDVNIISSSLVINSSGNFIRKQSTGDKDLQIRADSGVGISLTSNASLTWRIDTAGNIIPQGNYEIENNSGTKVFNSLAKIHTYTGSLRSEVNLIEAYTASLKGAIEVSGQNVNVLGMITAQQFNVTYVSSSTLYQSGSTKFGDTSDDRHEFTGSVNVSGSLVVQNGVSGSFSGSFTGNGAGLTQVPSASIASDLYKPTGTISVGIGGDSNIIQISGSLIQLGNPTLYTETLVSRQLAVSGGITVHNTLGNGFATIGVDNAGSAQIGANNNLNILLKNDGRSILYNGVHISASISVQDGEVLTLKPTHPLPSYLIATGSFAVSASVPVKPYFWDGDSWNPLY